MQNYELATELANNHGFDVDDVRKLLDYGVSPGKTVRLLKKKEKKVNLTETEGIVKRITRWFKELSSRQKARHVARLNERARKYNEENRRRRRIMRSYGDLYFTDDLLRVFNTTVLTVLFCPPMFFGFSASMCLPFLSSLSIIVMMFLLALISVGFLLAVEVRKDMKNERDYVMTVPKVIFSPLVNALVKRCYVHGSKGMSYEKLEWIFGTKTAMKLEKERVQASKKTEQKEASVESHCRIVRMYYGDSDPEYVKRHTDGFLNGCYVVAFGVAFATGLAVTSFYIHFVRIEESIKAAGLMLFWLAWLRFLCRATFALIWNDLRGFEHAMRRSRRRHAIRNVMSP